MMLIIPLSAVTTKECWLIPCTPPVPILLEIECSNWLKYFSSTIHGIHNTATRTEYVQNRNIHWYDTYKENPSTVWESCLLLTYHSSHPITLASFPFVCIVRILSVYSRIGRTSTFLEYKILVLSDLFSRLTMYCTYSVRRLSIFYCIVFCTVILLL